MVATKRSTTQVEVNSKEKKGVVEGGPGLIEPLGGFIFVCNNDTMSEDYERHLFGLPQRYQDSVKAIQPGLPLFLYNYSTRCLHGVFEASSDGGLNIEPEAWENKETRKTGRQVSRFPAQVMSLLQRKPSVTSSFSTPQSWFRGGSTNNSSHERKNLNEEALEVFNPGWKVESELHIDNQVVRVRWRDERPPLEEEKFRPLLYHYDGPKFRLELSEAEAEDLLKLFGSSSNQNMEEVQDDFGGEWERVKSKSKVTRVHRPPPSKRSSSPNSLAGRRRPGPLLNGSTSNVNTSVTSTNGDAFGRGREARADTAQRWRSDSDSWSGSSSAGISTSSWASHDEDRTKKGIKENGVDANGVGSTCNEFHEPHDAIASKSDEHFNESIENGSERDSRADSEELNTELNGVRNSPGRDSQPGSQSPSRPGFVSYSAALKAGMIGAGNELGSGGSISPSGHTDGGHVTGFGVSFSGNGAQLSSLHADLAGESTTSGGGKHEAGGVKKIVSSEGFVSSPQPKLSSCNLGELGQHERNEKILKCEGEVSKGDKGQVWGDKKSTLAARLAVTEGVSNLPLAGSVISTGRSSESSSPSGKMFVEDVSTSGKKSSMDGSRSVSMEGKRVDSGSPGSLHGRLVVKDAMDTTSKLAETVGNNIVWQGTDAGVLRRLRQPGSGTNSSSAQPNGVFSRPRGQARPDTVKVEVEAGVKMSLQPKAAPGVGDSPHYIHSPISDEQQTSWPAKHLSELPPPSAVFLSPKGHHSKSHLQGPVSQPSRSGHDPQRGQQYDYPKEKEVGERVRLRMTQSPSPDPAPPVMHSQQRRAGQSLMSLWIPSPSVASSQQQSNHPPSPALPGVHYRDHRIRTGSVDVGPHGPAYRLTSRGPSEGDPGTIVQGSWGGPSPALMRSMTLAANSMFPLPPPHLFANVEDLHFEILEFAHTASPSAEARICAESAVECVRDGVKRLWPSANVEVFGSYATGLCLSHSDVDVVVVDAPAPPETPETSSLFGTRSLAPSIRLLGAALQTHDWCDNITTIESAAMPVIKLHWKAPVSSGDGENSPSPSVVKMDITIGGNRTGSLEAAQATQGSDVAGGSKHVNSKFEAASKIHNGAATREYVIERLRQQPALAPLVLLLKSYLQFKGLKDVYTGGLGSFSLTIMLVFYLERVPISCGTPKDVSLLDALSADVPGCSTGPNQQSSQTSVLASASSGTDSLDSFDEESSYSSTDKASVSTRTSASSSSSSENSSLNGGTGITADLSTTVESTVEEPCIRRTGGIVEELLASMHTVASPNLGTLLIGFLSIFGREIDFTRVRLITKGNGGNGGMFLHDKITRPVALTIDDPLRPGANIGAGSFNMFHVQMALQEMLYVLTRPSAVMTGERVGMGPGRRRPLPLLDQVFMIGGNSPAFH